MLGVWLEDKAKAPFGTLSSWLPTGRLLARAKPSLDDVETSTKQCVRSSQRSPLPAVGPDGAGG